MRIWITVARDGRTMDRFEFVDADRLVVGRHESCDVPIDFKGISRKHCELVRSGDAYVLQDLGSSNGTFVRGEKIKRHSLSDGDVFSVVGYKLTYGTSEPVQLPDAQDAVGLPDMTMRVTPKALRTAGKAASGVQISRVNGHLLVEEGEETRSLILQQSVVFIGKDPKSDIVVDGLMAARMSAAVLRGVDGFWLLDLTPKGNAVTVNGNKMPVCELTDADVIQVHGLRLQYYAGLPRMVGRQVKDAATDQFDTTQYRNLLDD